MGDRVEKIISCILEREGGGAYSDVTDDGGGPTRWGVTQKTLAGWRRKPVTPEDVRNLTEEEARAIYRHEYVERPGFMFVSFLPLEELLVDCAVNHGPDRAVKWLQTALGVTVDGDFGSETKRTLEVSAPGAIYDRVLASRIRFYGNLISADHTQAAFAAGWMARAAEFVERA